MSGKNSNNSDVAAAIFFGCLILSEYMSCAARTVADSLNSVARANDRVADAIRSK